MKLSQLETDLGFKPLIPPPAGDWDAGYTSDLLSDVMGNAPPDSVLITIQGHKNTVAVATLAGIKAIILANSAPATPDMISSAKAEGIGLFSSPLDQFHLSCLVGALLKDGPRNP